MAQETAQALASAWWFSDTIPSEFVRMEHEQPGATTYSGPDLPPRVPIIDIGLRTDGARVTEAIVAASQDWGMFQIVNQGIPADVMAELQRVGREFFEIPPEEKKVRAADPSSGTIQGYGTQLTTDVNGKKVWGDFLLHNLWPPSCVDTAFWPKKPSSYGKANEEYTKHLIGVMEKIPDRGNEECIRRRGSPALLKINYYPPCPLPDLALGVVAHSDMSDITILLLKNKLELRLSDASDAGMSPRTKQPTPSQFENVSHKHKTPRSLLRIYFLY